MSDVVKGVLGGGWSLVVGWFLPTVINLLIFVYLVVPNNATLSHTFIWLQKASGQQTGLVVAAAGVLGGLLLAAVQTPLYRLLEGYVGWRAKLAGERLGPLDVLEWSRRRQVRKKQILVGRLDYVELSALAGAGPLGIEDRERLDEVSADDQLRRYLAGDRRRTAGQLGLLREKIQRYPVSDEQVVPTRLGNAIRRLEEYGYDRYRLDSQRLWYELTSAGPPAAVKQVDQARTTVDFLVALLYGHLIVAVTCLVAVGANHRHPWSVLILAGGLVAAARIWYEVAVRSTDDWAAAVRSLVNLGRSPLATALGLQLPDTIEQERVMWRMVASLISRPYHPRRSALDAFRVKPPAPADPPSPLRPAADTPAKE